MRVREIDEREREMGRVCVRERGEKLIFLSSTVGAMR